MARYTLTTRMEGSWRWASFNLPARTSKKKAIKVAEEMIESKLQAAKAAIEEDPAKAEDVKLWGEGGVTLVNDDGSVVWSRSRG